MLRLITAATLLFAAAPSMAQIPGPAPGDVYFFCMKNLEARLTGMTDPDLRKSFLDHAAEACVAAEARKGAGSR